MCIGALAGVRGLMPGFRIAAPLGVLLMGDVLPGAVVVVGLLGLAGAISSFSGWGEGMV